MNSTRYTNYDKGEGGPSPEASSADSHDREDLNQQREYAGYEQDEDPYDEDEEDDDEDEEVEEGDEADGYDEEEEEDDEEPEPEAPAFKIPSRFMSAVEHPFLIMDIDKGLETFGANPQFPSVLDAANPHLSVPLYLQPKDPTSRPMMSHYAPSHNVVFKVTVPKRTGRKRKRGSDGPWQGDIVESTQQVDNVPPGNLRSRAKLDDTKILRRKLQDNADKYQAEAVGVIKHTHRYRGMADFNYSMKNNEFMNNFTSTILSGDVQKFRTFQVRTGTDMTPKQEIIAPPLMTQITIPYYYHYSQNPYVRVMENDKGGVEMVNTTAKVKTVGAFIGIHDPVPTAPTELPSLRDKLFDDVVKAMLICMEERPVWTRRSIINRLVTLEYDKEHPERRLPKKLSQQIMKNAIQAAGYQFKGGPWRDALVRYGYDPRTDPSSRKYQCLIFRLRRLEVGQMGEMWQEIRKRDLAGVKGTIDENIDSHVFDGKKYADDGKVWQVCDLKDPLLAKLFAEASVRPVCDVEGSGWYHRGLWAKARAIMKCKMRAIQFGRELTDADFEQALLARDETPDLDQVRSIAIPTPDLNLTEKEWEQLRGKRYEGAGGRKRKNKRSAYHFPGYRKIKRLRGINVDGEPARDETDGELGEEDEDGGGEVRQTIEDENGVGVRFVSDDDEEGSEYDEFDEDDEDTEEDDFEEEDPDLAERLRLAKYDYTDVEQGDEDEDDDQDVDEDREDAGDLN